ncbi:hypothetical protein AOB60_00265 [Streptomyces noursei]|uniref:Uncharacterized protein n=1 Tax=Streptomyces noursei TaxID=1971 RepID=A0A2N8PQV8_STRNR|nr:hypothetical protein AOB60_00265 [Streptomyces noursei]
MAASTRLLGVGRGEEALLVQDSVLLEPEQRSGLLSGKLLGEAHQDFLIRPHSDTALIAFHFGKRFQTVRGEPAIDVCRRNAELPVECALRQGRPDRSARHLNLKGYG